MSLTSIPGTDKLVVGHRENFWIWSPSSGWDLTRSEWPEDEPLPKPKPGLTLPCLTSNITVDPAKTALVVIDMQNCSLHESLIGGPLPENMSDAQDALLQRAVPAARAAGIQVVWLNWGLTEQELAVLPPTNMRAFGWIRNRTKSGPQEPSFSTPDGSVRAANPETNKFFGLGEHKCPRHPGGDLGTVTLNDGKPIDAGRSLMKDSWNTALYGPCLEAYQEGSKPGSANKLPDVLLHKTRNSGLYDPSCEAHKYFDDKGIRTLIFAGVNTDQCVMGTLQDAHARGFDTIMLRDACATDSPGFAQDNAEYNNCISWGFLSTTNALAKAAGTTTD